MKWPSARMCLTSSVAICLPFVSSTLGGMRAATAPLTLTNHSQSASRSIGAFAGLPARLYFRKRSSRLITLAFALFRTCWPYFQKLFSSWMSLASLMHRLTHTFTFFGTVPEYDHRDLQNRDRWYFDESGKPSAWAQAKYSKPIDTQWPSLLTDRSWVLDFLRCETPTCGRRPSHTSLASMKLW